MTDSEQDYDWRGCVMCINCTHLSFIEIKNISYTTEYIPRQREPIRHWRWDWVYHCAENLGKKIDISGNSVYTRRNCKGYIRDLDNRRVVEKAVFDAEREAVVLEDYR